MNESNWRSEGLCSKYPEPFFDYTNNPGSKQIAMDTCAICPVLSECSTWIDGYPLEVKGIVAGTTEGERKRLKKERRAKQVACIQCGTVFDRQHKAMLCSDVCRIDRHNSVKAASYHRNKRLKHTSPGPERWAS